MSSPDRPGRGTVVPGDPPPRGTGAAAGPAGDPLADRAPDQVTDQVPDQVPDPVPDPVAVTAPEAPASMSAKVVRGASWSGASRLAVQGLQFAVGLVLARLLAPGDFGLIASVYVVSNFAGIFFQMGLGTALIHLPEPTERDKSTAFWMTVGSGVALAALLALGAPLVADFFDDPQLEVLMHVVAVSFALPLGAVHSALLQRELRFKTCAKVEVASAAAGHATTLGAALAGAGVVSLALGPLVTAAVMSVLFWIAIRWRPRHFVSGASLRRLWAFSGGMMGFNLVNYWGRNTDNLLIGRMLGATPLGLYNRAFNLMLLPVTQLSGALGAVMFPALTAMRGDLPRVRRGYLRALRIINAITLPFLVGMAAVAEGLVPLLWGSGWNGAVVLLQILCVAGVPQCLGASASWICQSQGRTNRMLAIGVYSSAMSVVAIVIGLQWGVVGVAWGILVKHWIETPITLHYAGRLIDLSAGVILRRAAPTVAAAALCGIAAWGLPLVAGLDRLHPGVLLLQTAVGCAVYALSLRLLDPGLLTEVAQLRRRRTAA